MKKIMFVTNESVVTGTARTGIADVVDGLAISIADKYDISVVAPDGDGIILQANKENIKNISDGIRTMSLLKVTYYLVDMDFFNELMVKCYEMVSPDILHNFADVTLLSILPNKPNNSIYTIDHGSFVRGKLDDLKEYDNVTTVSKSYAENLLNDTEFRDALASIPFIGITNGISSELFSPSNGFLLSCKYGSSNVIDKDRHKIEYLSKFGITSQPVFAYFGRLSEEKGIDNIISLIPIIIENGGKIIIMGNGDNEYSEKLGALASDSKDLIWVKTSPAALQMIPLMASIDFYLSPSIEEPCGLMPMIASMYGVIPMVTRTGGLKDNFDQTNSIVFDDNSFENVIEKAISMYDNKELFNTMRKICMERDFDWRTRNIDYMNIYS